MFCSLGFAKSITQLRQIMEKRCQVKGSALRIEKAIFTEMEGQSSEGCPIAKYIIRRYVKYLLLQGAQCKMTNLNAYILI